MLLFHSSPSGFARDDPTNRLSNGIELCGCGRAIARSPPYRLRVFYLFFSQANTWGTREQRGVEVNRMQERFLNYTVAKGEFYFFVVWLEKERDR